MLRLDKIGLSSLKGEIMLKIMKRFLAIIICFGIFVLLSNHFAEKRPSLEGEIKVIDRIKTEGYITVSKGKADINKGELILVNNRISYQFYENNETVSLYDGKNSTYKVRDKNVLLNKDIINPLNEMLQEFHDIYHTNSVTVISGYRSFDYQENLYNQRTARDSEQEAMKWVAKAGGSEHHTGYALDFNIYHDSGKTEEYTGKSKYKWINENAYKYGFIVRYPEDKKEITGIEYEPWHFRYIGKPHSFVIAKNGMCLEEYMEYLRQFRFGEKHLSVTDEDGKQYEIYYINELDVPVPSNRKYKISGNNTDGFIITIEL